MQEIDIAVISSTNEVVTITKENQLLESMSANPSGELINSNIPAQPEDIRNELFPEIKPPDTVQKIGINDTAQNILNPVVEKPVEQIPILSSSDPFEKKDINSNTVVKKDAVARTEPKIKTKAKALKPIIEPIVAAPVPSTQEPLLQILVNPNENVPLLSLVLSPGFSDASRELLAKLGISENHFDAEQIEIINKILSPSPFGKFINFILSISPKMFLLAPFVSKEDIGLPFSSLNPANQNSNTLIVLDPSQSSSEESSEEETCRNRCLFSTSLSRYISSPILIQAENTLKKIFAISAFHETTIFIFEATWNLILSSLIVHGIVNLIRFSDNFTTNGERLNYLSNIPTVTTKALQGALGDYKIFTPLICVPLVWGLLNAVRAWRSHKPWDKKQKKHLKEAFETYQSGIFKDLLGWIPTAIIPEFLPLFSPVTLLTTFCFVIDIMDTTLCTCLPSMEIQENMEEMKNRILWDGNLSSKKRRELFNQFRDFSKKRAKLITHAYAMSCFAAIMNGINEENLLYLKNAGADEDLLESLFEIKVEAFKELQSIATKVFDAEAPVRTVLSSIQANHLLWRSGHAQNYWINILSIPYQTIKWVSIGTLFWTIGSAIYEIEKCKWDGKKWSYIESVRSFMCHVCGDLPIPPRYIETIEDCTNAYFAFPRTSEEIFNFTRDHDLSQIQYIDLSNQALAFSNKTWIDPLIFLMKNKMKLLKEIYIKITNDKYVGNYSESIAMFINNSLIEKLTYHMKFFTNDYDYNSNMQNMIDSVADVLPNTKLYYLSLSLPDSNLIQPCPTEINIIQLIDVLLNSTITHLLLDNNCIDDEDIAALSNILADSNLIEIVLTNNPILYFSTCESLAKKIPTSKISNLTIGGELMYNNTAFLNASCFQTISEHLLNLSREFSLSYYGIIGSDGLMAIVKLLKEKPFILKKLDFGTHRFGESGYNYIMSEFEHSVDASHIADFMDAINNTNIETFSLSFYEFNASLELFKKVIWSLQNLKIRRLQLGWLSLGDEECQLLADALPNLNLLNELSLPFNQISVNGIKIISTQLNKTNINFLDLYGNYIGYGLDYLGEVLPHTAIRILDVGLNDLNIQHIKNFSQYLNASNSLENLNLGFTTLGDEGAVTIAKNLAGSHIRILSLSGCNIGDVAANAIAAILTPKHLNDYLWLEYLIRPEYKFSALTIPTTELTFIGLVENGINKNGSLALCKAIPQTYIDPSAFLNQIIAAQIKHSQGISFEECEMSMLSYSQVSHGHTLRPPYPFFIIASIVKKLHEILSTLNPYYYRTLPDAYDNRGDKFTITNIEDPFLIHSANQNYSVNGINYLIAYSNSHIIYYQSENLFKSSPVSNFSINQAEVCFYNKNCYAHFELIKTNDEHALNVYAETASVSSPLDSVLFSDLLSLCQTFIQSLGHSALIAAIPRFVSELSQRYGAYTKEESEQHAQVIQMALLLALSKSPYAISASYLAGLTTNYVTNSPQWASRISTGVGLVAAIVENTLSQDTSFSWLVLQTGVALVGSALGNVVVAQLPRLARWTVDKACETKEYLNTQVSFWSSGQRAANYQCNNEIDYNQIYGLRPE